MAEQMEKVKGWFDKLDKREQLIAVVVFLVVMYEMFSNGAAA